MIVAIYNQLKRYDGHKVGYVDGMAASIASVIMFACDELHFATGAQAMIHKPLCMAYGNADDFKAVIKQLNLCEDSILDVYMEHVQEGVTRDKIQSLMSNETWFDSKKMQQYFNVEIEEKAAVAACASDYFEKYNNIPEVELVEVEQVEKEKSAFDEYDRENGYEDEPEEPEENQWKVCGEIVDRVVKIAIRLLKNSYSQCMKENIVTLLEYLRFELDTINENQ